MALNRDQLQVYLDKLEDLVPALIGSQGHHFIAAFQAMVETIADAAEPGDDREWVKHEGQTILARSSSMPPLIPGATSPTSAQSKRE